MLRSGEKVRAASAALGARYEAARSRLEVTVRGTLERLEAQLAQLRAEQARRVQPN